MNRELIGTVEEWTADLFSADGILGLKALGLLDDRCLAGSFLAVGFDGHDVGSVHRLHHVEVLALVAHLHKLAGNGLKAHGALLSKRIARCVLVWFWFGIWYP